ncbi:hypothetical protein Pmani_030590 [Petrolisthes manimaculis]|uniref:Uncharacterized protein n=1 Tax=Petrolisthes manimaculis TaxID=1843537 RepID=A0AAE1NX29_9EUCA|nr:hypothetical protein Pmani_030590 [Petrolisthes manimaculis]
MDSNNRTAYPDSQQQNSLSRLTATEQLIKTHSNRTAYPDSQQQNSLSRLTATEQLIKTHRTPITGGHDTSLQSYRFKTFHT